MNPVCAMLRDLYRHNPEARYLQPWELQMLLWSLGYTVDLLDEAEIAAAKGVVWREFFVPFGPTWKAA